MGGMVCPFPGRSAFFVSREDAKARRRRFGSSERDHLWLKRAVLSVCPRPSTARRAVAQDEHQPKAEGGDPKRPCANPPWVPAFAGADRGFSHKDFSQSRSCSRPPCFIDGADLCDAKREGRFAASAISSRLRVKPKGAALAGKHWPWMLKQVQHDGEIWDGELTTRPPLPRRRRSPNPLHRETEITGDAR